MIKIVTIALCDIDPPNLGRVERYVRRIVEGHGLESRVEASPKRRELLTGVDFVVTSSSVGGPPTDAPQYFANPFKSRTPHVLRQEFPHLQTRPLSAEVIQQHMEAQKGRG